MSSRTLTDTAVHLGGVEATAGDKDMLSNWRSPPRPGEKSPEQGRPYNRPNREVGRRREGGGWVRSSDEADVMSAEPRGPAICKVSNKGRQGRDDKGVHRIAGPEAENIRQGEG